MRERYKEYLDVSVTAFGVVITAVLRWKSHPGPNRTAQERVQRARVNPALSKRVLAKGKP
jgi:hypothetical protein